MSFRRSQAVLAAVALVFSACAGSASTSTAAPAEPSAPTSASTVSCTGPTASASTDDWWRDRVFYEVFVRSFADSGSDGIGDLRGLIGRLDDLNDGDPATTNDLRITGLWLMPVTESPSYHGYDVIDYRTVERDYGTADDMRALVAEVHRRGIKVILDLVINHTSREHPWVPGRSHAGIRA
jgi:1,4-alpha-glucan branching enzyme